MGRTAIIRIDTNQGIYGLGEVRDGADPRYALMLKSRILGENPCNVEKIFKIIKQFGGQARQAGGVCAVEMALWDLCGKAYNVPAWQLLGGRYRDTVRIYADTPEAKSPEEQLKLIKYRTETQGYSWLKMDVSIGELRNIPGTLVNPKYLRKVQASGREGTCHMPTPDTRLREYRLLKRDWKNSARLLKMCGVWWDMKFRCRPITMDILM